MVAVTLVERDGDKPIGDDDTGALIPEHHRVLRHG